MKNNCNQKKYTSMKRYNKPSLTFITFFGNTLINSKTLLLHFLITFLSSSFKISFYL